MKGTFLRILLILLVLVPPSSVNAEGTGTYHAPSSASTLIPSSVSLDWQKTELENQLNARISRALTSSVSDNLFIVNVAIELKGKSKPKPPEATAPAATTPAAAMKDQWTAAELAGKSGDRIFLEKLDIDAPPPEMIQAEVEEGLFRNIVKVGVNILVDKSIPDAKVDLIKKVATDILKSVIAGVPGARPEVKIEKADLAIPPPVPEKWDLKRWLLEMKTAIAILLVSFLLCLTFGAIAFLHFLTYKKMENRKLSVMEAQNTREQAAFQAQVEDQKSEESDEKDSEVVITAGNDAAASGATHAIGENSEIDGAESGFDRLKSLLKENPTKGVSLIRQWIVSHQERGASEALAVLPQVLATDELMTIFNLMSAEERKAWKKFLTKSVDQAGYRLAAAFVSGQIVDSLLGNLGGVDESVSNKVVELSPQECLEIATSNPELGGMLVNILPSSRLGSFFSIMPKQLVSEVTTLSMKLQEEQMRTLAQSLLSAIAEVKKKSANKGTNAFLEKAMDLLGGLDSEKEQTVLDALATSGEHRVLKEAVQKYFPAELVLKLPPKLIKACVDQLPLSQRADLIFSRNEDEQALLLDSIGKTGSKGRDLIGLELKDLAQDEVRKKRIERVKENLWTYFIHSMRTLLSNNPAAAQQAEGILDAWLSEKTNSKSGSPGGERGAA